MKRIVSLVLALSMVLSLFTTAFAGTSLKDVEGTKYEAAVSALVELGIVNGYEDNTYRAEKVVTRAEMAKLLVIASGLEAAADLNKGATRFNDVAANHWATGYINVATEYGYVNGYPDGTFAPDATVTYAEAVTMAIRVLGYKSVVESKGTWPTNYIAKASELKALKDVDYKTYSDGATRGNVAILVWNVLRAPMWDVDSESEKDGLNYSKNGSTMINKYFDDYTYATVLFTDASINGDGKVMIKLDDSDSDEELDKKDNTYEYAGNDFYTFVSRTEVEVLVNEDDETLLTIVPTGSDTLVNGTKADLDDDYDSLIKTSYDYAYGMVEKKDITNNTILTVDSEYIYEAKTQSSSVKLNKKTYSDKDYDDAVVIIDGERASMRDVKEGMTLSKVTFKASNANNGYDFYVANSDKVEGKFTKYVEDEYKDNSTYTVLTIGGKEYTEYKATYVEDPEDSKASQTKLLSKASSTLLKDMKNESVVAYVDFIGRVVRVEFDGHIGGDTATDVKFFAATSEVEREKKGVYTISLEDANGSDDYYFEKNNTVAADLHDDNTDYLTGSFVAVWFNDNDEIVNLVKIARATSTEPEITTETDFEYDEDKVDGKFVLVDLGDNVSYDDDDEKLVGTKSYLVDDDTIVATITFDDNGTENKTSDDEYTVTFEEGLTAVEKIDKERALVIYDAAEKITYAKYVLRFDDATNRDDTLTGKVEKVEADKLNGEYTVTVDGTEYLYKKSDNDNEDVNTYLDGVIVFTLKENKDGDEYIQLVSGLTVSKVKALIKNDNADDYVDEVNGKIVSFETAGDQNIISKGFQDAYEDNLYVNVEISIEEGIDNDEVVVSVDDAIKCEDLTAGAFTAADRIIVDVDVVYIISGMDERDTEVVEPTPTPTPTPTPVKKYTIKFLNEDDTELDSVEVEEGKVPATAKEPIKAEDDNNTYTFDGWSATKGGEKLTELPAATEDATYYPVFAATPKGTTGA